MVELFTTLAVGSLVTSMGVYEWLIAGPGLLALIGVAVGYGALRQRVKAVEDQLKELLKLPTAVAIVEERTWNINNNVNAMNGKIDGFLSAAVNDLTEAMKLAGRRRTAERHRGAVG